MERKKKSGASGGGNLLKLTKADYEKNCIYWSNSCGDLFHGGEDIEREELPAELERAFRDLWEENEFGLTCFLAEFYGRYGISLEAGYSDCDADNWDIRRAELDRIAEKEAEKIAAKLKDSLVIFGKRVQAWSDGTFDTIVSVFVPWDTGKKDYERIGKRIEAIAYKDLSALPIKK